jgi:hypothetical protein
MEKKYPVVGPAGTATIAEGQQPVSDVIVTSSRDQRVLDWLLAMYGADAINGACAHLAGSRKPFPSNIAKILGATVPAELALTPKAEASRRLAGIKDLLRGRTR